MNLKLLCRKLCACVRRYDQEFDLVQTLAIILAVFVVLAALYSVATPIFEASDEVSHYAVVQHIADTGELAGAATGREDRVGAGRQSAAVVLPARVAVARLIDTRDVAERMTRNPLASPGDPSLDANRNLVIHSPAENFPWRNTTLAVHLIRFISIVMGAATMVMGYALARRIFPDRPSIPIGTALLIAFNPMFIFITASVNNDNLTIVLTSLALYLERAVLV